MSTDVKTVDLTIALIPRELGDVRKAIESRLNDLLTNYDSEVGGVLVKWSDLVMHNKNGLIIDDQPFIFYKISFTAQIFTPMNGKLLKDNFQEHKLVQTLHLEQEVYFRLKGMSEGDYLGELDEECLELSEGLKKQDTDMNDDEYAYAYAKDFEY